MITKNDAREHAAHRLLYAPLVNGGTIRQVAACIGAKALRGSTDPALNDIPLAQWDRATRGLLTTMRFADAGLPNTLSCRVCVAKEAARQWLEAQS